MRALFYQIAFDAARARHHHQATEVEVTTSSRTQATVDRARAEGAAGERKRVGAILTCEAAEGREKQARTLALKTDMTPEQAAKVLEASPKAQGGQSIEERANGEAEIGASFSSDPSLGSHTDRAWQKAVAGG
ncbi:hypothetical protein [Roseovarius sp.]|uniref:hypothetical protein n=1 Tax=Roseovarius sp. TaxID=1486281 RepID=UPI003BAA2FFF